MSMVVDEEGSVKRLKFNFPDSSWHIELFTMGENTDLSLHWNNKQIPTSEERLRPEDILAFQRFFGAKADT